MSNIDRRARYWIVMTLSGLLMLTAGVASAQDKTAMPDAQVESNVLRQLASVPDLSTQNIQTTTVYGTVTLSGSVTSEALRTQAEDLIARADGVKKVVDQLTIGDTPAATADSESNGDQAGPPPDSGMADANGTPNYGNEAPVDNGQPGNSQPDNVQPDNGQSGPPQRQPMYNNGYAPPPNNGMQPAGGQVGGRPVTVAGGAMLRIRINRGLDANHVKPGTPFAGTVVNDVIADGAVAIPRGAQVQGNVVYAKKAGAFKGQGELSLRLTGLTLGGRNYPLTTVAWSHEGRDKTIHTVNNAVGLGVLGALVGAVAGGGAGAAIGAGVGGAAGVASSASSPAGRVIVPPESMLTFHLAQPQTINTVSQQELERLSYAAGPPAPRRVNERRPPGYYYGPGY